MIETAGHFPGARFVPGAVSSVSSEHITHWDLSSAIYHIAFHLSDSVPTDQLLAWRTARADFEARARGEHRALTPEEVAEMRELYSQRVERYLANGHGACILHDERAAESIRRTLEHDNGARYELHAWTIMPNHVHIVVRCFAGEKMKEIVDTWKSVSAHGIVNAVGCTAPVWMSDHYSRIIRTAEEYAKQIKYVWGNPEAAGLQSGFLRMKYE